jgi:hypothetical protein
MKVQNNLPKEQFIAWELSSHDTIEVKRCYVDIAGDLVSGILLSQIIYWHLPNKEGKSKLRVQHKGDYWIAKKREAWWDECRITAKQFDRASAILKNKGLIEMQVFKFNGAPMKHIKLNWDSLILVLDKLLNIADITQRVKSILPKGEDGNLPKGKIHLDETVKSLTETRNKEYITKTTTTDTAINNTNENKVSNTNPSSSICFKLSELNSPINLSQQSIKALSLLADNNKRQEVLDVLAASMKKGGIRKPEAYLQTLIQRCLDGDFTPIKNSIPEKIDSKFIQNLEYNTNLSLEQKTEIFEKYRRQKINDCPYCDARGYIRFLEEDGDMYGKVCTHEKIERLPSRVVKIVTAKPDYQQPGTQGLTHISELNVIKSLRERFSERLGDEQCDFEVPF